MPKITFPQHEHDTYIADLKAGHCIWTSRIDKELGYYLPGQEYDSDLGFRLRVVEVNREKFSENHPNYLNLTVSQRE